MKLKRTFLILKEEFFGEWSGEKTLSTGYGFVLDPPVEGFVILRKSDLKYFGIPEVNFVGRHLYFTWELMPLDCNLMAKMVIGAEALYKKYNRRTDLEIRFLKMTEQNMATRSFARFEARGYAGDTSIEEPRKDVGYEIEIGSFSRFDNYCPEDKENNEEEWEKLKAQDGSSRDWMHGENDLPFFNLIFELTEEEFQELSAELKDFNVFRVLRIIELRLSDGCEIMEGKGKWYPRDV